ncbi:hypothetical protein Sjap_016264 [Stephania japonica]|uniref:Histidine kinase/HSP90-like ATPase domain-containing protein n=1 Tax=Stephania japonica TaxID=461633 RepID=A0AAP0IMP2_9MAGN
MVMMLSTVNPRIAHFLSSNATESHNCINRIPARVLSCRASAGASGAFSSSSIAAGASEEKRRLQTTLKRLDGQEEAYRRDVVLEEQDEEGLSSSASAVAAAIRRVSNSPVEFVQRVDEDAKSGLVLPSPDFQRLCLEQLDLFRRIIDDQEALLSVYVRPAGSYVMDRLELRRVAFFTGGANVGGGTNEVIVLIGNFGIPAGLRAAEAALSSQKVQVIRECRAFVFPMVKHPFVVGFLVAELPVIEMETFENAAADGKDVYTTTEPSYPHMWETQGLKEDEWKIYSRFTAEQKSSVINISRTLAMAYIMDQISYDIVEDILVHGDHLRDKLQQLQDAVYLTKANIMQYNEEALDKMHKSKYIYPESVRGRMPNDFSGELNASDIRNLGSTLPQSSSAMDMEMPMPPLALAALRKHDIRPCNVSDILVDLVGAAAPLASKQQRIVELRELSQFSEVAIEESALRQALSNLIEGALLRTNVGGKVEIVATGAPGGGALVIIDDDGPDMHYMTQMHSLAAFGADLFSKGMVEDNMTWNFVAGLTVAREILESYGGVVRVVSPRNSDAALGSGGTRLELWLPSIPSTPDSTCLT